MAAPICTKRACLQIWRVTPSSATTASISRLYISSLNNRSSIHNTMMAPQSSTFSSSALPRRTVSHSISSHPVQSLLAPSKARFASSSASTPSTSSTAAAELLTWNRFFDLRKKRRYINLVSSITTAVGTVIIAGPLLAAQDVDAWGAQLTGIDPVFVLGASTLAAGALGWLCGPSFGNLVFRAWAGRRGWNELIAKKEKSFYARIKRYRADPSSSSPQNPIPDYYGEKISSVKDYRRWLKDQKAFNLKKDKNML